MARMNTAAKADPIFTHEGGLAKNISIMARLRRSVLSCLLWEDEFYEDGQEIFQRIKTYAAQVPPGDLAALAVVARNVFNLRHVPLVLLSVLCQTGRGNILENKSVRLGALGNPYDLVSRTFPSIIKRADELSEFLAIHAKLNEKSIKKSLSAQAKKGLAKAFQKFDEYQLAKYNRDSVVKLRDVLFLCHAKPKDEAQAALWKRLINNQLAIPDTWETQLSAGADKKATFERLMREGNLGYLALLRNLRNMIESGVDNALIKQHLLARKGAEKVFPFRYIAAAKAAPSLEPVLDEVLQLAVQDLPAFDGKTVVLVDVSGSMDDKLSAKSDLTRLDAAAALAALVNASEKRIFSFSNSLVEVPPRKGMAGIDAVKNSQPHGSTLLGGAIEVLNNLPYDRLIVITDEQVNDRVPAPHKNSKNYMINVASNRNGIGYGPWVHIDGFSENVIRFIHESETASQS